MCTIDYNSVQKWQQQRATGLFTLYVGDKGVICQAGTATEKNKEGKGVVGPEGHLCQPDFYHNLTQSQRNEWQ